MKKILKIFSIVIAAILLIIILLFVIAKIKENEIAGIALRKIGKSINAPIAIDDVSLSLIRRFPMATVILEGVWLGSPDALGLSDSLISDEETLAKIERVYVSGKTWPLFRGEFEIIRVEIKGVDVSYIVDKQGISNFDFLISAKEKDISDTTAVSLNVMLKELLLRDIRCNYYDSLKVISARILIPKAQVNGKIKGKYMQSSAKGALKLSDCNYKATNLCFMRETEIDFNVTYSQDSVDVKELVISTDGADFYIVGNGVIKDTVEMDVHVQAPKINIDEFIKYIPRKTVEDIGLEKASGVLSMDASIKGFLADSIIPGVKMNVTMNNGYLQMTGYPYLENMSFTGYLTNGKLMNSKTTRISIRNFHGETGSSSVDMSFSLNNLDRKQYKINSGFEIDLGEFKKYIPDTVIYNAKGRLRGRLDTKGAFPDSLGSDFIDYLLETSQLDLALTDLSLAINPSFSIDSLSGLVTYDLHHITARDLRMNIPSLPININNASFDTRLSGKLSEPSNLGIDFKSFQAKTDSCAFYGTAKINNLKAPRFNITGNIKLNLNEIENILPDTLVNNLSGEITAQITSGGKLNLDSVASQVKDLVFKNSTFNVDFNRVSIEMPDTLMSVRNFSGKIHMKPDTIKINSTYGIYSGIDFSIDSTKIMNLYNSVIKNQVSRLYVEGRFGLGDLDYSNFIPFLSGKKTDETAATLNNSPTVTFVKYEDTPAVESAGSTGPNYTYSIKGKLRVKSLTYNKAVVENVSGLFNISDSLYLVDQLKFNGFDGSLNTSVRYEIRDKNEEMLWVKNIIEKMNVKRLLEDFDNFKDFYEPEITHENISGILTSRVDAQVFFKNDSMIRNKMYVRGDIKLERGVINNYQPVKDMEPRLPGIDNLDVLEFKTINSNVFVFQDAVYVPTTLVISNKLDATALGMQSFGEDYSYHFIVFLSDILYGKSDRRKRKQDEMGEEITSAGRKGRLVKSYSLDGKRRSGLDTKSDQEKMRSRVKASEALLNLRFHPNMVNYNTGVN
ncbi:MAG: AsmA family protein [Bacteroidales bacterium]|nr:MAG: AsmA family protein [Bacteroidales bacterium]